MRDRYERVLAQLKTAEHAQDAAETEAASLRNKLEETLKKSNKSGMVWEAMMQGKQEREAEVRAVQQRCASIGVPISIGSLLENQQQRDTSWLQCTLYARSACAGMQASPHHRLACFPAQLHALLWRRHAQGSAGCTLSATASAGNCDVQVSKLKDQSQLEMQKTQQAEARARKVEQECEDWKAAANRATTKVLALLSIVQALVGL